MGVYPAPLNWFNNGVDNYSVLSGSRFFTYPLDFPKSTPKLTANSMILHALNLIRKLFYTNDWSSDSSDQSTESKCLSIVGLIYYYTIAAQKVNYHRIGSWICSFDSVNILVEIMMFSQGCKTLQHSIN